MRFVKLLREGRGVWGVLHGDVVRTLTEPPFEGVRYDGESLPLSGCRLLAPCEATKIVCIGKNYFDHIHEMKSMLDASNTPDRPTLFLKAPNALNAHLGTVHAPDFVGRLDYEGELAAKLDEIARRNGVTVLGTGINPGLIMDLLVILWTGACESVDHIVSRRVNSLSPFGPAVMEEQGIGLEVAEFEKRKAAGTMTGHVGFAESIRMITDALGWKLDKFEQDMEPIVTDVDRKSPYGFAAAGHVAGVAMKGWGTVDGQVKIEMDHPQQIEPEQVGIHTGDYVEIQGIPPVNMVNTPEIEGGIGTMAMIMNCIPHVINARPGLKTMVDIPVPHAIMGDMRDMIEEDCKLVK